jgi:rRNA pseudouridine-1189 N-methylase Emg1 (Nep1/Mra1 family)
MYAWLQRWQLSLTYAYMQLPVQKVFIKSKKNALVDVHTQVRLPRTFRRFCGLFAQLLQKLSVRSTNSKERMLKVCSHERRVLPRQCIFTAIGPAT